MLIIQNQDELIKRLETFIIASFFQSYLVSLLLFKTPLIYVILPIFIISLIIYLIFNKFFGKKEFIIKKSDKYIRKDVGICSFLLSSRILFSVLSLHFGLQLLYIFFGLTGLDFVEEELTQIVNFSNNFKILQQFLNCGMIQLFVLV